jgi:hypothetical protein
LDINFLPDFHTDVRSKGQFSVIFSRGY